MKLAFVINDINTEYHRYTTPALAMKAHLMDHEVYLVGVGDLSYTTNGHMKAFARKVPKTKFKSSEKFLEALKASEPVSVNSKDLDVLFLRNNPADEIGTRDWAQNAPYIFGQIALLDHVIVLNHPATLSDAINKMYFQHFPEVLRPKTIITRNQAEIEDFYQSQDKRIILKPLQGSGGKNVFLLNESSHTNMAQIVDAIGRDGFVIAQEYLEAAAEGDTRLFLMNGEPLMSEDGQYAAIKRVNESEDVRSNISAGGKPAKAEVTEQMLEMADILRPKLIKDGMFMVGIDIVGDKLMEINVFSPGGLNMMSKAYDTDFLTPVIHALEKKVQYRDTYGKGKLDNINLATL